MKRVYWVGMPRMGIGWFNKRMELMNGVYKAEAAKRAPQVEYIDAWTDRRCARRHVSGEVPAGRRVHMTVEGGVKVAKAVLAVVAPEWHLRSFK